MKRKRKNACPSPPLLDDSPKRPKVQAQRKFAQGSNVNSPVITPIKELEDIPRIETLPEPVELLPMKRPNTEDFLTFLCFRGTPILPPSLNFFNTASIVDMNGQVHEIKSESSSKNGPIDIAKCGNSSEKPFIAFGVRKRADPIVISKQMDRKRRHALALQALRRKYQEQKMAKIRAIAISKHSEKVTNKTLVKTNTVSKTETVTKKNNTLQKTKIVATKHIKVTTQTLKTTLRPKINQKMCLRSFRGRFIHKELPFRKKIVADKKINRPILRKIEEDSNKNDNEDTSVDISDTEDNILKPSVSGVKSVRKVVTDPSSSVNSRMTRSGIINKDVSERLKQKRLLITNTKPLIKSRLLRSTTMKKTILSRRKSKKQLRTQQKKKILLESKSQTEINTKTEVTTPEKKIHPKNDPKQESSKSTEVKKDFKKVTDIKKESNTICDKNKKQINKSIDIKKEISKSTDIKKKIGKVEIKRNTRVSNIIEKRNLKKEMTNLRNVNTRLRTKDTVIDNKEKEDDVKDKKSETSKIKKSGAKLSEAEEPKLKSKQNEGIDNDFCKTRSSSNKESTKLSSHSNQSEIPKKSTEDIPKRKSNRSFSVNKDTNLAKEEVEREKRKLESTKKDLKKVVTNKEEAAKDKQDTDNADKIENSTINKDSENKESDDDKDKQKKKQCKETSQNKKVDEEKETDQNKKEKETDKNKKEKEADKNKKEKEADKNKKEKETDKNKKEKEAEKNKKEKETDQNKSETSFEKTEEEKIDSENLAKIDELKKQTSKDNPKKKKVCDNTKIKEDNSKNEGSDKQKLTKRSTNINSEEVQLKTDNMIEESNDKNKNEKMNDLSLKKQSDLQKDNVIENISDIKEEILFSENEHIQIDDLSKKEDQFKKDNEKNKATENNEDKLKNKVLPLKKIDVLPKKKDDLKKCSSKDVDDKVDKLTLPSKKKDDSKRIENNQDQSEMINVLPSDCLKQEKINEKVDDELKSKVVDTDDDEYKQKNKNEPTLKVDALTKKDSSKKDYNDKSKNKNESTVTSKNVNNKKEEENLKKKLELSKKKDALPKKKAEINKIKIENEKIKEDNPKNKVDLDLSPKINPRPTRKTKEAAAIYMEILSHKLVDNQIDDDNISIDSFPELPNVKKTEQRENELKAQAKFTKDEIKGKSKDATESTIIEPKGLIKDDPGQNSNSNEEKVVEKAMTIVEKPLKIVEKPMKIVEKPMKIEIEIKNLVPKNLMEEQEKEGKRDIKEKVVIKKDDKKKKSNVTINTVATVTKEAETSNEILQTNTKRQTRSAHLNKTESSEDSDQSFHINIKVPRKKKLTRSKTLVKNPKNPEKPSLAQKGVVISTKVDNIDVCSISDSDESTSDINLQALINKEKNKKFSKTKSKKSSNCFSDSDEEPLSKLTNKAVDSQSKSKFEHLKESRSSVKTKASSSTAVMKPNEIENERKEKPKRECAKRPQNYLPMFSSSDDEDTFHGFDEKVETRTTEPILNPVCSHASPLLDFFAKDISRRFGKEKVNMSNEQIEKWLTESALAGSSIKKENDEMLKFGEKIPTETTLEINESIDTVQLKTSLLQEEAIKTETRSKSVVTAESNKIQEIETKQNVKPQVIDRKLIFRKSKIQNTPNINAFSPENESSIYAFGEDNEDVISTPFRRPSRRPSSTATSRSEDEFSKNEESTKACQFRKPPLKQEIKTADCDSTTECEESHFYIPQNPSKVSYTKQHSSPNKKFDAKTFSKGKCPEKMYDTDDFKYKVPSSPSASSSSSTKLYKRQTYKSKVKTTESVSPIYMSDFPKKGDPAKLVEAPTFHPTDQEFQDPLEYIERIRHKAEQFGICRIVPPNTFKPECKVTDDMRFTAYNQYVHKMLHRWGPNFKELMAIKKYLETQNISITQPPWIGGMEIDLPRLYQTVQNLGGLKEVIEKKKWPRVSDLMKIPKSAQDRVTKLDDIYCKYLLPYDTLSPAEREKLFDDVETEWAKRESKSFLRAQEKSNIDTSVEGDSDPEDNDVEECITKGRNMALNGFYRIARNTMSMYFKTTEPPAVEVEQEYWNYVMTRQNHICVHSGSIDSGSWGYGFAISKNSPFARHPWNLKVLTNNNGSLLRSLGPAMGVTVPTLHVGMVFSACCWYRDPHGLPWIEYLHTGGSKIWYAIPNSMSDSFHSTMKTLVPNYCRNKELWLPSDTAMVPPNLLVENNVSLCRTVQDPGQFIVVFPKVFTSSLSTGYVVSESVYFAPTYWLKTARSLFDSLRNCSEPSMFCLDRLLLSIASDVRCNPEILRQVIPHIQELCDKEKTARDKLRSFGQMEVEKLAQPEINKNKKKLQHSVEGDYECDICRASLFISVVFDTQEGLTYCLNHAIEKFESQEIEISKCKLIITYDYDELTALPDKMKTTIEIKLQKKNTK